MEQSFFRITDESAQEGHYIGSDATIGPWNPQLAHGGPPNALVVRAAERTAVAETGRTDLNALRLAAEFTGPVPVGELHTRSRIVRAARSAVLVEVVLDAADRDCIHARVWLVRAATDEAHDSLPAPTEPSAGLPGLSAQWTFGYAEHIEWRVSSGDPIGPGPATVWARPRVPLVPDEPLSTLQHAALIGDSASGVSAVLNWDEWSFLNVDLDIHVMRSRVGHWLLMDAQTHLGPEGAAVARSTLHDGAGMLGGGLQTLVVQRTARQP